jgi:hypothetical protein
LQLNVKASSTRCLLHINSGRHHTQQRREHMTDRSTTE